MLDELPRIENSAKSPCWQQEQIAAQNSYLASIKAGKVLAYKAPCRADPAPAPKKQQPVPTVDADKARRVG